MTCLAALPLNPMPSLSTSVSSVSLLCRLRYRMLVIIIPPCARCVELIPIPYNIVLAPLVARAQVSVAVSHATISRSAIVLIYPAISASTSTSEPAGYFGFGMRWCSVQDWRRSAPMMFGIRRRVVAGLNSLIWRVREPLVSEPPVFSYCSGMTDVRMFLRFRGMATGRSRQAIVFI